MKQACRDKSVVFSFFNIYSLHIYTYIYIHCCSPTVQVVDQGTLLHTAKFNGIKFLCAYLAFPKV